ncbi:hypothetical protein [Rhodoplanes azumiensis]|uniref:Uncharacterized protein n=1 Tax=Rhodoplanes azumiensis TaxID=1897628 RepID=A0ABW5AQP5_9BRAD
MDATGDPSTLALIELVLALGAVAWFATRELRAVRRDDPPPQGRRSDASARDGSGRRT